MHCVPKYFLLGLLTYLDKITMVHIAGTAIHVTVKRAMHAGKVRRDLIKRKPFPSTLGPPNPQAPKGTPFPALAT
jgi:hypothetical protein